MIARVQRVRVERVRGQHSWVQRARGRRRTVLQLVVVSLVVGGLQLLAPAVASAAAGVIASTGPLSSITTSALLNCDVRHVGDTSPEFYGSTACGTLVASAGVLYGPSAIPAGSSAAPRTSYTAVSQTSPTGAGTSGSPYVVTTVVTAGSSMRLTQVDSYVVGQENYRTSVTIQNLSNAAISPLVYRAGDCYLANSDYGYGAVTGIAVSCTSDAGRVEQWVPLTAGSHYYEAGFAEVWARIGSRQPFPDTCRCTERIDNGAGLSWQLSIGAGASATVEHLTAFAPTVAQPDADGDGLPDTWETAGLDINGDGTIDLDLPAMGATPDHVDIFAEVDWMDRPQNCIWEFCWGGRSFAPNQAALADVRAAFAAGEWLNPDGTTGIRMHIDSGSTSVMNPINGATWGGRSRSDQVPYDDDLGFFQGTGANESYNWSEFNALELAHFDAIRRDVFHYVVFGDEYGNSGSSGIARGTTAGMAGNAFIVTDGPWSNGFTQRQEAGTFMHELGHNLGLHHGGDDDTIWKPNYRSIMNYSWQFGDMPLDYSREVLGFLNEASLNEQTGVTGTNRLIKWWCSGENPLRSAPHTRPGGSNFDWDCDGSIDTNPVSTSINGYSAIEPLHGYHDWPNLVFDGGQIGAFGINDLNDQAPPPTTTQLDEPSREEFRNAQSAGSAGDGAVRIDGPSVLYPGINGQAVTVTVSNEGATPADYLVTLTGLPGAAASAQLSLAGGAELQTPVIVDTNGLLPGDYLVTATLTPGAGGDVLAVAQQAVTVPDMNNPAVRAAAAAALGQLTATPPTGFDPAVLDSLVTATTLALNVANTDEAGAFASLPPARILDTRSDLGADGPVPALGEITVDVTGVGGVPLDGVSAVALNVTAVQPTTSGYLTVWPAGEDRPTASSLNFQPGSDIANLVVVPVGADGSVSLFNGSFGSVQLLADVAGFYIDGDVTAPGGFTAVTPSRVLDTRIGQGFPAGGPVMPLSDTPVVVTGLGGIPDDGVAAVALNITAVAPDGSGYLTAFPSGLPRPVVSNVNFEAGRDIANAAVVTVGPDGLVLFNGSAAHLDLLADTAGYYVSGLPTATGMLAALNPSRILDTRDDFGADGPAAALSTTTVAVAGHGGVPLTGVAAVILTVTAVSPTNGGYLTVWPTGTAQPTASSLNFRAGQNIPNQVIVPLGPDGTIEVFNGSAGTVQLLADVSGYLLS